MLTCVQLSSSHTPADGDVTPNKQDLWIPVNFILYEADCIYRILDLYKLNNDQKCNCFSQDVN